MNLKKILKNKQWYNQRFDGSPLFLCAIGEADHKVEKRKPKGTEGVLNVCFYGHGKADWYFDTQEFEKGSKAIIKLAKKDPKISAKLLKKWRKDELAFERFFWQKFPKINLTKLSNKQLLDLFDKNYHLFTKATSSTSTIDRFALGTDELIGNMLRREVFSEKSAYRESEFTRIFSTLTAPVHQSFINQAEIDLLKIILKKSKETLEQYQRRYFWTKNNYVTAQVLTLGYFEKEIRSWKKSGKNLLAELRRIQHTPRLNRVKKQKLLKKLHLSRLLKILLKISEDFTWWQDERKKYTYFNIHMGAKILEEIGRRLGYTTEELKYCLPNELGGILKRQRPSKIELKKRIKGCVFLMIGGKYRMLPGNWEGKIKKIMFGIKSRKIINDFRGLSASTGRVIGPVKVVKSATEAGKVEEGDILVAVMTRPDYVVAMKKAAAIVTNEGGITSHAAIVSRELGIPCIIGTKIATEVLKDGDRVEVNANHGWVRKLN